MLIAPLVSAAVGGLASGAASAGVSSLLGGLFGGGSSAPSPEDMMQALVDAQEDSAKKAAELLIKSAQEASDEANKDIEDLKDDYANVQTKQEFRQALPQFYKNMQRNVSLYGADPALEWNKLETAAVQAGLNPTDSVRIPGQGRYTLSTLRNMMQLEADKSAPERWNTAVRNLFADNFERNPTKQEANWYSYDRFKSIDDVMKDLAQRNPDFYNQNIASLNPSQAMLNQFVSGMTSLPTTSTPGYERIDPSEISYHGYKPLTKTSTSTKTSSSRPPQGIDTSNPRPRGFEDFDKKSKGSGYADFG